MVDDYKFFETIENAYDSKVTAIKQGTLDMVVAELEDGSEKKIPCDYIDWESSDRKYPTQYTKAGESLPEWLTRWRSITRVLAKCTRYHSFYETKISHIAHDKGLRCYMFVTQAGARVEVIAPYYRNYLGKREISGQFHSSQLEKCDLSNMAIPII